MDPQADLGTTGGRGGFVRLCEYEPDSRQWLEAEAVNGPPPRGVVRRWTGDGSEWRYRAEGVVGFIPFVCAGGRAHVAQVAPRGSSSDPWLGLQRFFELAAYADVEGIQEGHAQAFSGGRPEAEGAAAFSTLLASFGLERATRFLRRDGLRADYVPRSDDRVGGVRGAIDPARHLQRVAAGRAHHLPCRWREFQRDNPSNQILASAVELALCELDRLELRPGWRPALDERLALLEDARGTRITERVWSNARLGRVSAEYRSALGWAGMVLRLTGTVEVGDLPELVVETPRTFERFVQVVLERRYGNDFQPAAERPFIRFERTGRSEERVILDGYLAGDGRNRADLVVEVKYKDYLEVDRSVALESNEEWLVNPDGLRVRRGDLFQVLSYSHTTGARRGAIVFPLPASAGVQEWRATFEGEPETRLLCLGLGLLESPAVLARRLCDAVQRFVQAPAPAR